MIEYGITFKEKLIRQGFSKDQVISFMKAKCDDKNYIHYRIVTREIGEWQ